MLRTRLISGISLLCEYQQIIINITFRPVEDREPNKIVGGHVLDGTALPLDESDKESDED